MTAALASMILPASPPPAGPAPDDTAACVVAELLAEQDGCHQDAEPIVARAAKLAGYPGVDRPDELFVALLRATATVERALAGRTDGRPHPGTLEQWIGIYRQAPRSQALYLALMGPIVANPGEFAVQVR